MPSSSENPKARSVSSLPQRTYLSQDIEVLHDEVYRMTFIAFLIKFLFPQGSIIPCTDRYAL